MPDDLSSSGTRTSSKSTTSSSTKTKTKSTTSSTTKKASSSSSSSSSGVPEWSSSKTYKHACTKVQHNGKVYMNGWYSQGEEPDSSDEWGTWREVGSKTMHSQC
eukprot:Blabericola_migrator_1__7188@NODE_3646_length_1606_cov_4_671865_g1018_i1_p2_GENE_NODE_3646_length_1606_cov_4_671865_g1018_i1NODE_3646_length_1606_cov_4_671865_g1018_i1_p2_ORF_typecomplete_len104_score12_99CBM_5_12_2/PF14600_6/0_00082CBM_5_12/PF02839_14/0_0022MAP65_ASE1/PF03999_12/1_6Podoplanin/PF05808_11/4_1SR25/PF10500_9/9_7_NODE_3646_length_1606_cov_4_671865_g1018_i110041315